MKTRRQVRASERIRAAILDHEKAAREAARILASECGIRHTKGSRPDLCPSCNPSHVVRVGGAR